MIRNAHIFQLHQGKRAEYERAHNPLWPQLEAVLQAHGAHNYSIFLDEKKRQLFASSLISKSRTKRAGPPSRKPKFVSVGGPR